MKLLDIILLIMSIIFFACVEFSFFKELIFITYVFSFIILGITSYHLYRGYTKKPKEKSDLKYIFWWLASIIYIVSTFFK